MDGSAVPLLPAEPADEGYLAVSVNNTGSPVIQELQELRMRAKSNAGTLTTSLVGALTFDDIQTGLHHGRPIGRRSSRSLVGIKLGLLCCGMSVFARTELFLLQTTFFAMCFQYGVHYYAMACGALFLPGFFVNLAQAKWDNQLDKRFGTRAAGVFRVVTSTLFSLVVMGLYLAGAASDSGLRDNLWLHLAMLIVVGSCVSITFGTLAQTITTFPPSTHVFFYVGTMCPFTVFAPVNAGLGDLCPETSTGFKPQWVEFWVFTGVCALLTLSGLAAYLLILFSNFGSTFIWQKDLQIAESHQSPSRRQTGTLSILRATWPQLLSIVLVMAASTLIAALYIEIPHVSFKSLTSVLLYEYYISAAIGMFLSRLSWVRDKVGDRVLITLSALRCFLIPLTVLYIQPKFRFRNDFVVLAINFVQMLFGGGLFTLCFSLATEKFRSLEAKGKAATFCNFAYFSCTALFIGLSLFVH